VVMERSHLENPLSFSELVTCDLNDDGKINASDFISFALAYGKKEVAGTEYARYDFNQDGMVNASDFILFALAYGKSHETGLANSLLPVLPVTPASFSVVGTSVDPTEIVSTIPSGYSGHTGYSGGDMLFETVYDLTTVRSLAVLELYGLTGRPEPSVCSLGEPEIFDAVFEDLSLEGCFRDGAGAEWWSGGDLRMDGPVLETVLADLM